MARGRGRRRRRPNVRRRRRVLALLVLTGLAAGGWQLARSSLFHLSRIDVVGAHMVARQAVLDASGLRVGQSALGLDLAAVERRVARLPEVRRVRAERKGTAHVRITIEERTPAVVGAGPSGRWLLDRDGRVLGPAPDETALPVVRMSAGALPPGAAGAVAAIWDSMADPVRARVRWFAAPSVADISFRLGDVAVVFGRAERVAEKIEAVLAVERRLAAEGRAPARIDVRSPRRPAARPR